MDIKEILKKAVEKQASDIHLKVGTQPIIRVRGKLYLLDKSLPALTNEKLADMMKSIMSNESKNMYKEHKNADFGCYFPNVGRFRFCVFSQKSHIRVVARVIKDHIPNFEDLHLPPVIEKIARYTKGMVLITGATGSGKSTTAASMLDYINRKHSYHIITLEDPIEYVMHDHSSCISQRELYLDYNNKTKAFQAALRQDPDVIFFGETRDEEAMATALHGAESGHLIISTLHTSTAVETIDRCLSFFSGSKQDNARHSLIHSLKAVVSQRLVPSLSGGCVPAVEVLINNMRVQEMLIEKKSNNEIHQIIEQSHATWDMQSFDQHLLQLYQEGKISQEAALQSATHPKNVQLQLDGFSNTQNETFASAVNSNTHVTPSTPSMGNVLKVKKS